MIGTNYQGSYNMANMINSLSRGSGAGSASRLPQYDYASKNIEKITDIFKKKSAGYDSYKSQVDSFNKESSTFYKGLYSAMGDLKASSSSLKTYSSSSATNPDSYASSDNKVVTVDSTKGAFTKPIDIKVTSVASGEVKTSAALDSKAVGAFGGNGTVALTVGGKTTTLDVNLSDKATNEGILSKIADSVNKAGVGITAKVVTKDSKSALEMTSTNLTDSASFSVALTGKGTEAIAMSTTSAATEAAYTVGGKDFKSVTNKISLDDGNISATLTGAGGASIKVGATDAQRVLENVQQFATDFNSAVNFLSKNSALSSGVKNLSSSISDVTKFRGNALSSIGISVDSAGKLAVDSKTFKEAFISDATKVKSLLGNFGGIAEQANSTASAAMSTSQNLLKPPKSPFSNSYSTYSYSPNKSSFNTRSLSSSSGLLMDMLG